MDCSTPGFPILHSLLGFTQTHIHWINVLVKVFTFVSGSKDLLTKQATHYIQINNTNIYYRIIWLTFHILTLKERERERAENISLNWVLTSSAGNPMSQHIWSPSWERVPGSGSSAPWVRLQRWQFGVPAYNPRKDASWYHHQAVTKLQAWFPVYAVCFFLDNLDCC